MDTKRSDIIAGLKKEILALQGFKSCIDANDIDVGLGPIKYAFPGSVFPIGATHEFICINNEGRAATTGFVTGILSSLISGHGVAVWIGNTRSIYPPALKSFGIDPDKMIFIQLEREKDIHWAVEEALKCDAVTAVIGEMETLSFTSSRRFQLAVEQTKVTGFFLRSNL